MKIGLLKHRYVGFGGGSERYHRGLVDELRRRGHEIHVFAGRTDVEGKTQDLVIHRVPVVLARSFLGQLSFALACRQAVQREPCDLIFSAERTVWQDICRAGGGCHREWLRQRARYGRRLRTLTFGLNPLHLSLLWLERQMFDARNTRFIIANSHRGKEEIIQHYRFPEERIVVIHNGVACDQFTPGAARLDAPEDTLLFVGSGFERKGLQFCIEALARLPAQVRLLVTGKGRPASYLRRAAQLGVGHRVEFLGATADIRDVYRRGDLLVHPAIYEPFSNACLEAMASGLPVVTSRVNGASEIINPGVNGAIVDDPGDTAALADAIRPFLDRRKRAEAAGRARRTAESLPVSLNVDRTLEVFERVRAARQEMAMSPSR